MHGKFSNLEITAKATIPNVRVNLIKLTYEVSSKYCRWWDSTLAKISPIEFRNAQVLNGFNHCYIFKKLYRLERGRGTGVETLFFCMGILCSLTYDGPGTFYGMKRNLSFVEILHGKVSHATHSSGVCMGKSLKSNLKKNASQLLIQFSARNLVFWF